MRLVNQILDFYDMLDSGDTKGLEKVASTMPDLPVMSSDARASLADKDYALVILTKEASKVGKFPIHTGPDTFLSNIFFEKNAHKMPAEASAKAAYHIKAACQKFGILPQESVVKLSEKTASDPYYYEGDNLRPVRLQKTASLSEMAEAQKIATNYTFAQYAFPTPSHVEMGVKYFEKFASEMPLEIRHGYAESLQKIARDLGMSELQGEVVKYAGDRYSALVGSHIRSRASLLDGKDPSLTTTLNKLAASKKSFPPSEFAKALHAFDKHAGLNKYYGGALTDPYQATFASEPDKYSSKTASSRALNDEQLNSLASSKYAKIKEYFGSSLADEFKKDSASIFDSLPLDAKEIIIGIGNGTL